MATGYGTRDTVNPIDPGQVQSPQISGPGVMSPRSPALNAIGQSERELADALGGASAGMADYVAENQKQWELDGQMMYAEGKAEADVIASGNRYTTAGYMTLKAKSGMNTWFQKRLDDIGSGDNQLDGAAYRKKLSQDFTEMRKSVAGDDEFTKNLIGSMASEYFPKLVEQQVKSNNEYSKQETYKSGVQMLASEANRYDPTDSDGKMKQQSLKELMHPEVLGIKDKALRTKAITEATVLGLKTGNTALFDTLGITEEEKIAQIESSSGLDSGLLSYVLHTESRGNRYDKYGNVLTSPKGAKGEMQVMDKTNLDPGYGVAPAMNNSLEERARVGRDYLAAMASKYGNSQLALAAYNAGPGNVDAALKSAGDPRTGSVSMADFMKQLPAETQKYVAGYSNAVSAPAEGGKASIGLIKKSQAVVTSLIEQGFAPAEIEQIMSAHDASQSKKVLEFNQSRIMFEQALVSDVETNGNLPAALDTIEKGMGQYNYNDAHANSLAQKVLSANEKYQNAQAEMSELRSAIGTNTIRDLDGGKQKKAVDILRNDLKARIASDSSIPNDQKESAVKQQMAISLAKNDVVDDRWKNQIDVGLSGDLLDPANKGSVKTTALQAYKDILDMEKIAGERYANKYLDGDTLKLVTLAKTYDAGSDPTPTALIAAQQALSREKINGKDLQPIRNEDIQPAIDQMIDGDGWYQWTALFGNPGLNTGVFRGVGSGSATDSWDVTNEDVDRWRQSPVLRSALRSETERAMMEHPNLTPQQASTIATKGLSGRMEFAGDNVLVYPVGRSIREDMGLGSNTQDNAVNKAVGEFLKEYGGSPKMWGSQFNSTGFWDTVTSPVLATKDALRGVPAYTMTVDPASKMAIFDLYTDKSRTQILGQRFMIPLSIIGKHYVDKNFVPDNTNYVKLLSTLAGTPGKK